MYHGHRVIKWEMKSMYACKVHKILPPSMCFNLEIWKEMWGGGNILNSIIIPTHVDPGPSCACGDSKKYYFWRVRYVSVFFGNLSGSRLHHLLQLWQINQSFETPGWYTDPWTSVKRPRPGDKLPGNKLLLNVLLLSYFVCYITASSHQDRRLKTTNNHCQ